MKQKSLRTGTDSINDIFVGAIVSAAVLLASISVFAILIIREIISEAHEGYCSLAILLISSMSGTIAIRRRRLGTGIQICLIVSAINFTILSLVTVIFFGAKFQGAFVTSIVVFSGCLLPVVLGGRKKSKRKATRNKMRHG